MTQKTQIAEAAQSLYGVELGSTTYFAVQQMMNASGFAPVLNGYINGSFGGGSGTWSAAQINNAANVIAGNLGISTGSFGLTQNDVNVATGYLASQISQASMVGGQHDYSTAIMNVLQLYAGLAGGNTPWSAAAASWEATVSTAAQYSTMQSPESTAYIPGVTGGDTAAYANQNVLAQAGPSSVIAAGPAGMLNGGNIGIAVTQSGVMIPAALSSLTGTSSAAQGLSVSGSGFNGATLTDNNLVYLQSDAAQANIGIVDSQAHQTFLASGGSQLSVTEGVVQNIPSLPTNDGGNIASGFSNAVANATANFPSGFVSQTASFSTLNLLGDVAFSGSTLSTTAVDIVINGATDNANVNLSVVNAIPLPLNSNFLPIANDTINLSLGNGTDNIYVNSATASVTLGNGGTVANPQNVVVDSSSSYVSVGTGVNVVTEGFQYVAKFGQHVSNATTYDTLITSSHATANPGWVTNGNSSFGVTSLWDQNGANAFDVKGGLVYGLQSGDHLAFNDKVYATTPVTAPGGIQAAAGGALISNPFAGGIAFNAPINIDTANNISNNIYNANGGVSVSAYQPNVQIINQNQFPNGNGPGSIVASLPIDPTIPAVSFETGTYVAAGSVYGGGITGQDSFYLNPNGHDTLVSYQVIKNSTSEGVPTYQMTSSNGTGISEMSLVLIGYHSGTSNPAHFINANTIVL